jgi:hypothetical protein
MPESLEGEIERMYRVSDLMVTAHSTLRDRYIFRARVTDIILLVGGGLVAAFTFLDPAVAKVVLPSNFPASVLVGLAGIGIFVASLVQMKMDWNGRSALHGRAAESYLSVKHELGRIKCFSAEDCKQMEAAFASTRDHYEAIGGTTISVPERLFPKLKQAYRLKVEISKALDARPGASILLLRFKIWWRDNVRGGGPHGPSS